MTIVAIASPKGGAGRTTTTLVVASLLAQVRPVWAIDLDPQAQLTAALNVVLDPDQPSLSDLLADRVGLNQVGLPWPGDREAWLIPARSDLVETATAIAREPDRVASLAAGLAPLRDRRELALIDCPAGLGWLTLAALTAADWLLIPLPCQPWAVNSLALLTEAIAAVRRHRNPRLQVLGLLPTFAEPRSTVTRAVLERLDSWTKAAAIDCLAPVTRSAQFPEAALARSPLPTNAGKVLQPYQAIATRLLALT